MTARVAIVTGGSSGMGAATAAELSRRGWKVAISYSRDSNKAAQIASACKDAIAVKGDVAQDADCRRVAAEVLANLESGIEQARAEVVVEGLPAVVADPLQMRQLLQNLIGNALKFRKAQNGHRVTVGCRPGPDGRWEIHVTDNGIGFEERFLDRIFKPFQKLHSRSEYGGYGMGLALCQKIVTRHGGQITARSRPGEGSDFIVHLPRRPGAWEDESWTTSTQGAGMSPSSSPKMMTTISR